MLPGWWRKEKTGVINYNYRIFTEMPNRRNFAQQWALRSLTRSISRHTPVRIEKIEHAIIWKIFSDLAQYFFGIALIEVNFIDVTKPLLRGLEILR